MPKYLTRLSNKLPSLQISQIKEILDKEQIEGKFSSQIDYAQRFSELLAKIQGKDLIPLLDDFGPLQEDSVISSKKHVMMLENVARDIGSLFGEFDNLDDILDSHNQLFFLQKLSDVQDAINDLKRRLDEEEFIAGNIHGFTIAKKNTFDTNIGFRTGRDHPEAGLLFSDPQEKNFFLPEEDAVIQLEGDRLILPDLNKDAEVFPVKVEEYIDEETSYNSKENFDFSSLSLDNLIDGTLNTFWVKSLLLLEESDSAPKLKLLFRLPSYQTINSISFRSIFTDRPLRLESIKYIERNGQYSPISFSSSFSLDHSREISFSPVFSDRFLLTFSQSNFEEVEILKREGEDNVLKVSSGESSLKGISNQLIDAIQLSNISKDLLNLSSNYGTIETRYEYLFGFDNIQFFNHIYRPRGIFVSEKIEIKNVTHFGFRATELRPYRVNYAADYTNDSQNSAYTYFGSYEYFLIKKDFDENNVLLKTSVYPIYPYGQQVVKNEKISLRKETPISSENIARLIGYADPGIADFQITKDLTTSVEKGTYPGQWDFYSTITSTGGADPMELKIVVHEADPLAIYSISYSQKYSNIGQLADNISTSNDEELLSYVDKGGKNSAILDDNGILFFKRNFGGIKIKKSEMYFVVILRNLAPEKGTSPILEDYTLGFGSDTIERFD